MYVYMLLLHLDFDCICCDCCINSHALCINSPSSVFFRSVTFFVNGLPYIRILYGLVIPGFWLIHCHICDWLSMLVSQISSSSWTETWWWTNQMLGTTKPQIIWWSPFTNEEGNRGTIDTQSSSNNGCNHNLEQQQHIYNRVQNTQVLLCVCIATIHICYY